MNIKISPLDRVFSQYVRFLSGGYCKKCHKYFGKGLHTAHFHSRRKHSVRWDLDNVCALCYGCHSKLDGEPYEKIEFWLGLLGQERLAALDKRAESLKKVDKEALLCHYKSKLKEIE